MAHAVMARFKGTWVIVMAHTVKPRFKGTWVTVMAYIVMARLKGAWLQKSNSKRKRYPMSSFKKKISDVVFF